MQSVEQSGNCLVNEGISCTAGASSPPYAIERIIPAAHYLLSSRTTEPVRVRIFQRLPGQG